VVHELWHIGPHFDGDLRRHHGRCYAHGPSQAHYDARVEELLEAWLAAGPPEELYEFLKHNFRELVRRHGAVFGLRLRRPRLIPLDPLPDSLPISGGPEDM